MFTKNRDEKEQDLLGQVSRLRKREEQIPPLEWVNPVAQGLDEPSKIKFVFVNPLPGATFVCWPPPNYQS